jgi:hypothetical protein
MMMLTWKKTAFIPPGALLDALVDPPMPEPTERTKAVCSLCFLDGGAIDHLKHRIHLTEEDVLQIGSHSAIIRCALVKHHRRNLRTWACTMDLQCQSGSM